MICVKKFISILAGLMLLLTLFGCDENKKPCREAEKLMESEQYSEAADAFAALGDYNDCSEKVLECKYKAAEKLLQDKKIKEAMEAFGAIEDYSDSKDRNQEIKTQYYFENDGYIIPQFNVIYTDAKCQKSFSTSIFN